MPIDELLFTISKFFCKRRKLSQYAMAFYPQTDCEIFYLNGHAFSLSEHEFCMGLKPQRRLSVMCRDREFEMVPLTAVYEYDISDMRNEASARGKMCLKLAANLLVNVMPEMEHNIREAEHNLEIELILSVLE